MWPDSLFDAAYSLSGLEPVCSKMTWPAVSSACNAWCGNNNDPWLQVVALVFFTSKTSLNWSHNGSTDYITRSRCAETGVNGH